MAISFIDSIKKLVNNADDSNDSLNNAIIIDDTDIIAKIEGTPIQGGGLSERNVYRAKHVFGSFENVDEALRDGTIDQYDTMFLKDVAGKPYVGWIDENGDKVFIESSSVSTSTMLVTFTANGTNKLLADKTMTQILEAHDNGTNVIGFYQNSFFNLTTVGNNEIGFASHIGVWYEMGDGHECLATAYRIIYMDSDDDIYYYQKVEQGLEKDTYSSLTTTSKKVIGAINELDAEMDSHNHDDTYYTIEQIDAMEFITTDDIDAICGGVTEGGLPLSDVDELMAQLEEV